MIPQRILHTSVVVIVFIAVLSSMRALTQVGEQKASPQSQVSAQTGNRCPSEAPDEMGIHYQDLGIVGSPPPKITADEAVQIAASRAGIAIGPQSIIGVRRVLYTDDNYYTETSDDGGGEQYFHVNVPAWVVTFCGLNIAGGGPPGSSGFNHELNVAINSQTGDHLATYIYR